MKKTIDSDLQKVVDIVKSSNNFSTIKELLEKNFSADKLKISFMASYEYGKKPAFFPTIILEREDGRNISVFPTNFVGLFKNDIGVVIENIEYTIGYLPEEDEEDISVIYPHLA